MSQMRTRAGDCVQRLGLDTVHTLSHSVGKAEHWEWHNSSGRKLASCHRCVDIFWIKKCGDAHYSDPLPPVSIKQELGGELLSPGGGEARTGKFLLQWPNKQREAPEDACTNLAFFRRIAALSEESLGFVGNGRKHGKTKAFLPETERGERRTEGRAARCPNNRDVCDGPRSVGCAFPQAYATQWPL